MIKTISLVLLVLSTCLPAALSSESSVRRYVSDLQTMGHFYDADLSLADAKRLDQFLQRRIKEQGKVKFAELTRQNQVDHLLMLNHQQQMRLGLTRHRANLKEDLPYLPFLDAILTLDRERRQAEPLDDAKAAKQVADMLEQIKEARKKANKKSEAPKEEEEEEEEEEAANEEQEANEDEDEEAKHAFVLSKAQALRVASRVKTSQQRLEKWYKHYAVYRPQFDWWMKKPYDATHKALAEYEKHLREKIAGAKEDDGPLIGEPVGRDHLNKLIAGEFIPYSAAELIAIGEKEFAWCADQAVKAAKEMGFEDRLKALEEIKNIYVQPGEQDQLVARYAREAIEFVEENKLVTVPYLCKTHWDVDMIDQKMQQRIPYAMYGGNRVVVAFAGSGMEHNKKEMAMRGNNLHATRIVTAHEVIPGHHLQRYMASRYRSDRNVFSTPFFVEGWALYWEMRLWDLDFARGPEDRIGMLFWRMHRCARIIVSLKFHLGEMTPNEMVDFLVEEVGHEKAQARSEVRRYIGPRISPLYQAGYMLGGLQLKNLHDQLVPKEMTEREFHDRILKLGSIPVDMIRASLDESIPLSADYQSAWRFYPE